ncbi:hypothetical protein Misp01_41740 [Microtetraspora sp. NBRC 13810]|uniref:hypothetical protein n=1 Tax=Microtetraspora sp. NBRC 13810 TaxID=3030990 RepID=UPI0025560005|nr:hypothetical protein [Microtetraspora sp. NBRC 13810]GLW09045.1 hypothetical protein Misp01_41740 [Microtetraspora sp. NBRC 13810]
MRDFADEIAACGAWAAAGDRRMDPDTLALLLRTHHDECHESDPARWTPADVELVAEVLAPRTGSPEAAELLVATWLTWCDYTVETGSWACGAPRPVRTAIEECAPGISRFAGDPGGYALTRSLLDAAARHGVDLDDDAALTAWLGRAAKNPGMLAGLRLQAGDHPEEPLSRPRPLPLPAVRLAPLDELAPAARVCPPLDAARELALWTGEGRALPAGHDGLTAEDASAAAAELGVTPPELARRFGTAVDAGFLRLSYTHVLPGPALTAWPGGDDEAAVRVWSDALPSSRDATAALLLTTLFVTGVPLSRGELAQRLPAASGEELSGALKRLAAYGALRLDGEHAATTPLADHAVARHLERVGQRVDVVSVTERTTARELLEALTGARDADLDPLRDDWLAGRDVLAGAGELLAAVQEPPDFLIRTLAVQLVSGLGQKTVPLWREHLTHPTLAGWARRILPQLGVDLAEPDGVERMAELWTLLDTWGSLAARDLRDEIAESLAHLGAESAQVIDIIWRAGHPAAPAILTAIGTHAPDKRTAKAARRAAYKLGSTGTA